MNTEELIEINKPDTVANNFLFDLVQDLGTCETSRHLKL